jgi:hypothetical protein
MADPTIDPDDYKLHQVERGELHEEWIWIRSKGMKPMEGRRSALLFSYKSEGESKSKSVCCETLYADDLYLGERRYPIEVGAADRENRVFMNAWYRHQLGIEQKQILKLIPLKVRRPRSSFQAMWWQLRACARHPQITVVMSTVLAVIGTGLGIVGFAAVLKEILNGTPGFEWAWLPIAGFGFIIFVAGFWPLYLRAKLSLPKANQI